MKYKINEIQEMLSNTLTKKRYLHTLGVQYTSANLAMCYKCDILQAQLAGLLHDCAKYMADSEILEKCKKFNLPFSKLEERSSYLLHAKLGAYYAKCKYGINNTEILNAITFHTTGRANMSLLEKIVFLADYIEPGRKMIPGLNKVRTIAFQDLDRAVYLTLKHTLIYLTGNSGKELDTTTNEAYEYYKKLQKE